LAPGAVLQVKPKLENFSRIVLRPTQEGLPVRGQMRLTVQGLGGGGFQVTDVDAGDDGVISLFPVPVGELKLGLSTSASVSEPRRIVVTASGGGRALPIPVAMVAR
jgi:hypothetical protein